jgi:hypothetical protein
MAASSYQFLNTLQSIETCEELVHGVIDYVCGKEGPKYSDFSKSLSLEQFCKVKAALTQFVKRCVHESEEPAKVVSLLTEQGVEKEKAVVFAECLSARNLSEEHFKELSSTISYCTLDEFEWNLKVAFSSDKLSDVQEPLVSLQLALSGPGSGNQRLHRVEMNRHELNQLISSLEACNKVVQSISPAPS